MTATADKAVEVHKCYTRRSRMLVGLEMTSLNGLFGDASIMPVAVAYTWTISHSISGSIRTGRDVSVVGSTIPSDPGGIFGCLDTCTRRRIALPLFAS